MKTFTPHSLVIFCNLTGMFQCKMKKCKICPFVSHRQKAFLDGSGKTYTLKFFFNCSTKFVIYCLSCPCGFLYVGRYIPDLANIGGYLRLVIRTVASKDIFPSDTIGPQQVSFCDRSYSQVHISGFQRLCNRETY